MLYRLKLPSIYRRLVAGAAKLGLEKLKLEAEYLRCKPHGKGGRWPVLSQKEEAEVNISRFISRIELNSKTGCWEWSRRGTVAKSYGQFKIAKVTYKAATISFALFVRPVPMGLCVCHKCDNPPCVRPDHLFLGTQNDNVQDCWGKGRGREFPDQKGESNVASKLTEKHVFFLRNHYKPPMSTWAKKYGVSEATLYHALKGDTWRHL